MIKKSIPILLSAGFAQLFNTTALAADETPYLPFEIVNNSKIADDNDIYIVIKAMNIANNQDCFMHIEKDGKGICQDISATTTSSAYSYKLADLPKEDSKHKIFIPKVASGRVYVSIGQPLDLAIDKNTMKIIDPDGFKPRDVNFYTIYDKIEFSYNDYGTWINPTAVDFFSIPLRIEQKGSTSDVTAAGYYDGRAKLISEFQEIFNKDDKTHNKMWGNLFINFKNDEGATLLRVVSPGKAMVPSVVGLTPFNENYLYARQLGGFSYIDYLWKYYRTHKLIVDATEIKDAFRLDDYIFTGQVVGDNFVFNNHANNYQVVITRPETATPFFAGAGDSFDAENNTPKAIIIRQLTSAFEVGLLPTADGIKIDKNYLSNNKTNYYKDNPLLPKTIEGPWYDLYSKALHSLGEKQPIYTFAYDDALGQDGTLHDPDGDKPSTATLTIGDMTGSVIPNPLQDTQTYNITAIVGHNSTVMYNGKMLNKDAPSNLKDVKIPFEVEFNDKPIKIYIKHPMVLPYFEMADGIVIERDKDIPSNVTVIFPGLPDAKTAK